MDCLSREYYVHQHKGDTVSYSRLSTFNNCEWEFYLSYILHKPKRNNIYGFIGGETHDIVQSMQQGKMTKEEGLKRFLNKIDELKMFDYSFPTEKVEKNFVECVSHYIKHFEPITYKKQDIEIGYDIYCGKTNTLVLGFIDLLIHNSNDNEVIIYDYKTSSKYSKVDFNKHKLQLLGYAKGVINQYNLKPIKTAFDMLKYCNIKYINNKNKEKQYSCVDRNKIGSKMRKETEKLLEGRDDIDLILDEFEKTNEIPEILKDKIKIENYYKEVDVSELNLFDEFVDNTIEKINKKNNANDYKPKYITERTSFYCNILCGQRNNCKYYKYFLDHDLNNLKQTDDEDDCDLF